MLSVPSAPQPGEHVRVRDERWRVTSVAAYESCAVVECAGAEASNAGAIGRFIMPFEPFDRHRVSQRPRLVRPAVWRRAAAGALASASPQWRSLRSAAQARISLLPYQLEPALAMTRGAGCRMLLADEVGLGKTIQAGLLIAEVLVRHPDARVLIVTPAGLREQWREELRERFSIDATIVDAARLARTAADLPPAVNPWSIQQVAIASIDFLKRADVIRSLEPLVWDLVAFDEAHSLCGRSDRATAAALVAARARRVVIITATPHNGDDAAYERLRDLGRLEDDERLLVFRRSRSSAGVPRVRKERWLGIVTTDEEGRMHRALRAYARRVAREAARDAGTAGRLAVLVLQRRAASSAASLARSLERRLALLAGAPAPTPQLRLPLDDGGIDEDDEPLAELAAPALTDAAAEQRWLNRLLLLARAVPNESKIERLRRFLGCVREPALVFTEYRDTLRHVVTQLGEDCAVIHGGLSAAERSREIRRFTHGTARVLLATDAASEGVNLHHRCRLVINLDVPWTPLRLEQRVGRVDRLGQSRIVHAVTFIARGTSDAQVASVLTTRGARAAREAPFDGNSGDGLRDAAAAEAERLAAARRLTPVHGRRSDPAARPVLSVFRRGRQRGELLALRLLFVDAFGAAVWDTVVGLRLTGRVDSIRVAAAAAALHGAWLAAVRNDVEAETAPLVARERTLVARLERDSARLAAALVQAGLFDSRALRKRDAQHRVAVEAGARSHARIAWLERRQAVEAGERLLAFAAAWPR
jgi:superfamily II DNA or RNA helicase